MALYLCPETKKYNLVFSHLYSSTNTQYWPGTLSVHGPEIYREMICQQMLAAEYRRLIRKTALENLNH